MALTRDDLGIVAGKLFSARTEWSRLGVALKIGKDKLDAIAQERGDERDRLRSVLNYWLSREPTPTWADLVNALRKIGKEPLARKLEPTDKVFSSSKFILVC